MDDSGFSSRKQDRRSAKFRCVGHYHPWDGHEMEVVQGIDVEEDKDMDWVWLLFWSMGSHRFDRAPGDERLRDRLRNAYRMLRGKSVVVDEIILEKAEAERLATFLFRLTAQPTAVTATAGNPVSVTYSDGEKPQT